MGEQKSREVRRMMGVHIAACTHSRPHNAFTMMMLVQRMTIVSLYKYATIVSCKYAAAVLCTFHVQPFFTTTTCPLNSIDY